MNESWVKHWRNTVALWYIFLKRCTVSTSIRVLYNVIFKIFIRKEYDSTPFLSLTLFNIIKNSLWSLSFQKNLSCCPLRRSTYVMCYYSLRYVLLFITLCAIIHYVICYYSLRYVLLFITLCAIIYYVMCYYLLRYVLLFITLFAIIHYVMCYYSLRYVLLFIKYGIPVATRVNIKETHFPLGTHVSRTLIVYAEELQVRTEHTLGQTYNLRLW